MKSKLISSIVALAVVTGGYAMYKVQPTRYGKDDIKAAMAAQRKIDEIAKQGSETAGAESTDLVLAAEASGTKIEAKAEAGGTKTGAKAESSEAKTEASESNTFKAKFACSNGDFVVEVHPDWAPLGAARFKELVEAEFFTDVKFFRVVTKPRPFVVQFGISGDPEISKKWRNARIKDEPVKHSNTAGTLTFACAGRNSRTTQLFINLGDNSNLDGYGFPEAFPAFGEVVEGMDVVRAFNGQYQDAPTRMQGQMQSMGNAFLDKQFPGLDYIKSAKIIE